MNQKTPWTFGLMAIVIAAFLGRGVLPQGAGGVGGSSAAEEEENKGDKNEFCPAPCLYQEFLVSRSPT